MLDDPTFSIQSAPAVPNRKLAQHLVQWMPDHKDIATKFEKELIIKKIIAFYMYYSASILKQKQQEKRCGLLITNDGYPKTIHLCEDFSCPQ